MRINEEKILKMIMSEGKFIKDYRMKGRVLLMVMMRIYEKILKMIRSDEEFIEEDHRMKRKSLIDDDEDQ
jgi:hypothetical protein